VLWLGDLQIEEVNREVITSGQEVETCNNQVTELRRQLQALEIDLQAQLSQVRAKLRQLQCGHCTTALLLTVEITHGAVTRE